MMAKEYIFKLDYALYNEETGEAVFKPQVVCELIRCVECEHRKKPTDYCEKLLKAYVPDDFYCFYGKRKDGAE